MLTDKKQQQANVQLDLSQAETILCEKCGNGLFIQSFFLKKLHFIDRLGFKRLGVIYIA